ncbi:Uncharacterised protein [Sporosarcina pasteurii]|uniref:Uncharacterized protein n=1 Tax=Sporosarcina pasteurii TaxID=1474 RepID=A0A380BE64_SPOPA|nr:Uncharacterised protein [Sporosarcina pasteurii]
MFVYVASLIGVEGGDSCGISRTGETPEGARRLRRLTAGPTESVRPERKSTLFVIGLFVKLTYDTKERNIIDLIVVVNKEKSK